MSYSGSRITRLNIKLHILSPVHIGCGEVYEPTSFVIDPDRNVLVPFDPVEFVKALDNNDKIELTNIASKGTIPSIIELYRFISNKRHKVRGREIEVAKDISERYREVKALRTTDPAKIKQELNRFEINRTAYNSYDKRPYIPGTSLKGALRTGYLSMLACAGGDIEELKKFVLEKEYKPARPIVKRMKAKALEDELLAGSFSTDPFRMLKVSDFMPVGTIHTKILYAVNIKKDAGQIGRGPSQIFEVVLRGSTFDGTIQVQLPLDEFSIPKPFEEKVLLKSVHKHYARVYLKEKSIIEEKLGFQMPKLVNVGKKQKEDIFLVRLGRHSGAEAVTIEGNRKIKIMQGRGKSPKYEDHATTIWLSSNNARPRNGNSLTPFGWAVLEVL
ncbi:MAG: type III-A CRISPR-associated RAMP protein Csm5 [Nitrospirae bacterium]|nr:type III-A CRISPR-associated RAMP protein Csm5 [Nitrospirota bacterium]